MDDLLIISMVAGDGLVQFSDVRESGMLEIKSP